LARQPLELTRQLLGLLDELLLSAAARAGVRRARRGAFVHLLLAPRELLEPLERLVDARVPLLLLAPLEAFVLVAELVHLELEQVGQLLALRRRPIPPAAALLALEL